MTLRGKNAVIYGAGSAVGTTVARAFAREGASVYLAGRSRAALDPVAKAILEEGGVAEISVVDPLNSKAVEKHASYVANEHGTLDVSFNLAFRSLALDPRLTGLSADEFATAAFTRVRSNFITAITAARKMAFQGSGSILAISAEHSEAPRARTGGDSVDGAAIEALFQHLAAEVGPYGVRVACLRLGAASAEPMWDEVSRVLDAPPVERGTALAPQALTLAERRASTFSIARTRLATIVA